MSTIANELHELTKKMIPPEPVVSGIIPVECPLDYYGSHDTGHLYISIP